MASSSTTTARGSTSRRSIASSATSPTGAGGARASSSSGRSPARRASSGSTTAEGGAGRLRARDLRRRQRSPISPTSTCCGATAARARAGARARDRSSGASAAVHWMLHTADAQGLYQKLGFSRGARRRYPLMERPASRAAPSGPAAVAFAAVRARASHPAHRLLRGRPEQVHRVLLLYSGGLDTSVMLKWIQDEYDAEVVCLTVNLGQPGEDYEVIEGKALQLGALECHVVDAREEFAREYVAPAIKANALYGGGYPLFTALGRPLIAKLAVEHARAAGCDTIAHGCTGKGNDQVRIEATIATLAPELKVIAPVRSLADGPRGGDRLRARARHPGQGRHRVGAVLDRRQPLGALLRGPLDRGSRPRARGRRLPARHAPRARARRGRDGRARVRARRAGRARTASASSSSSCSKRSPRSARATASASSTTSRTASSG